MSLKRIPSSRHHVREPLPLALILILILCGVTALAARDDSLLVDGIYLKAFQVALAQQIEIPDLTERQKHIEGYRIAFSQDKTYVYVDFVPKVPPGWRKFGGDTPNGRSARYTIDKKDFSVKQRQFSR